MTPTDEQLAFTVKHEGKVLDKNGMHRSYRDILGNWTNGYGHLLPHGPVPPITEDRAQMQLREDLATAAEHVLLLCPFLDKYPKKFAAFTDLVFNVGYQKIKDTGHNTVQAFNYHQWDKAKELFLKWDKGTDLKTGKLVELAARPVRSHPREPERRDQSFLGGGQRSLATSFALGEQPFTQDEIALGAMLLCVVERHHVESPSRSASKAQSPMPRFQSPCR